MKRIKTLRFRFALWTSTLFLVILTGFGFFIYMSMSQNLYGTIDNSLSLNAAQVIAGLNIDESYQIVQTDSIMEEPETNDLLQRGYTIRLLDPEGKLLHQFGLHQAFLPAPAASGQPFFQRLMTHPRRQPSVCTRVRSSRMNDLSRPFRSPSLWNRYRPHFSAC